MGASQAMDGGAQRTRRERRPGRPQGTSGNGAGQPRTPADSVNDWMLPVVTRLRKRHFQAVIGEFHTGGKGRVGCLVGQFVGQVHQQRSFRTDPLGHLDRLIK